MPRLNLRPAEMMDLPPLMALIEDYAGKAFDDFNPFNPTSLRNLIEKGELWILDDYGYAVGFFRFSDRLDDLHVLVFSLIRPDYLRRTIRERLFEKAIDVAFTQLKVSKIKAMVMENQSVAKRLLIRYKFKPCGFFKNETRQNNKRKDVSAFELHRRYWNKYQKRLQQNPNKTFNTQGH